MKKGRCSSIDKQFTAWSHFPFSPSHAFLNLKRHRTQSIMISKLFSEHVQKKKTKKMLYFSKYLKTEVHKFNANLFTRIL